MGESDHLLQLLVVAGLVDALQEVALGAQVRGLFENGVQALCGQQGDEGT